MERRLSLLAVGFRVGLLLGLVEAALSLLGTRFHWVNSSRGNSALIWAMAPLVNGVAGLGLGGLATAGRALKPSLPWDRILISSLLLGGAYLVWSVPAYLLSDLAIVLLTLGVTVQGTRHYTAHPDAWQAFLSRTALALVGLPILLAAGGWGLGAWQEHRALGRLASLPAGTPNILLLVMDTQRADRLSAWGYQRETSPRLDQLAREGVRYALAQSSSAWTLPSHASLMTGKGLHQHSAGLIGRQYLDGRFPALSEVLADQGYATGGFVANVFWTGRNTGIERGFIHYDDFFGNPGDALVRTELGRRIRYDLLPHFGWVDLPGRRRAPELNRRLLSWVDRLGGRPFFAFVNYFDVHSPLLPPEPFRGMYSGRTDSPHRPGQVEIGRLHGDIVLPDSAGLVRLSDAYDESIRSLDAGIGALCDSLAGRGLLDNTILVITADHGEAHGEHGLLWHGASLYRDQTWVPLILRWPGHLPAATVVGSPVSIEQIPATITQLSGMAGRFDNPLPLTSQPDREVLTVLARRSRTPANWPASRGSLAAWFTYRWHYIELKGSQPALFDVATDPDELTDLAGDPANAAIVQRFHQQLVDTLAGSTLDWSSGE